MSPGYSLVTHQDWTRRFRPSFPSAPTSGTRPAIVTGGSARSLPTPRRPPNTSFASWTTPDQSSSSSLLHVTLRLLERDATRGAFKLVKVDPFSKESCATSTSPVESNLMIPSRLIEFLVVMVGSRLVLVVAGSSQVIRVFVSFLSHFSGLQGVQLQRLP